MLLQSITFGLAVGFMLLGIVGVVVPLVPGMLLLWLTLLAYGLLDGFQAISLPLFLGLSLFAGIAGTADLWLPLLGARASGSSSRSLLAGVLGSLIGFLVLNLIGAVLGYAVGIIIGEYRRHGDWRLAARSSLGGLAGWGLSTLIQLGGGLIILGVFVWRVLTA